MAGQIKLLRCVVRVCKHSGSVASVRRRAFHLQSDNAKLGLQGLPWFCGARGLLSSREDSSLSKPPFTLASGAFSTSSNSQENNDEDASSLSSNQQVERPLGSEERMISVTFVDKHGDEKAIKVPLGLSMLEAAHQNGIELEGACEGSLACSTCHVIVMDEKYYSKLPEPSDEENDMLDLAFGLTETSRLGCQVLAKPELDGMRLAVPSATRNFAVDGYVPKPH